MTRYRTAAVVLCGLALTGCSSSVKGSGSVGSRTPAPPPSTVPSPCSDGGGKVVTTSGAPYCYVLPQGMQELKDVPLPGGGDFTTTVGFAGRELIAVTTFKLPHDADAVADAQLQSDTDHLVATELGRDFTMTTRSGERLTVAGVRALHYHGRSKKESLDIDFYFVFRATTKIQINCQFQNARAQITAGCASVLQSLRLQRPH